jgi:hypothetical protein
MVDYRSLGLVAVALAVATGGALVPVVAVTGLIALVALASEGGGSWYRRRHPRPAAPPARHRQAPPEGELSRWMAAVERVLGSHE